MLLLLLAAIFPAFSGYVVDSAGVIDAASKTRIEDVCARLDRSETAQAAVATVRDLGGLDRRQYAVELFKRWKLGHSRSRSDGLLLLFTPSRSGTFSGLKVEVGYDLEGVLNDGKVGALMDQHAGPLLRGGQVGPAALALLNALAGELGWKPPETQAAPATPGPVAPPATGSSAGQQFVPMPPRVAIAEPKNRAKGPLALAVLLWIFFCGWQTARSVREKRQLSRAILYPTLFGALPLAGLCGIAGAPLAAVLCFLMLPAGVVIAMVMSSHRCPVCARGWVISTSDRSFSEHGARRGARRLVETTIVCSLARHVQVREVQEPEAGGSVEIASGSGAGYRSPSGSGFPEGGGGESGGGGADREY